MTSTKNKTFFALLFFVSASLGEAVSRVGGGKVCSTISGFELSVPSPFVQLGSVSPDVVRASGPKTYVNGQGIRQQFIDIVEFETDFKDLSFKTRDELRQEFLSAGWTEMETSSCVVHLAKENGSVIAHIVSWGSGQGYILRGPFTNEVSLAMDAILKSQRRASVDCSWK
jgi:hypothetical protein